MAFLHKFHKVCGNNHFDDWIMQILWQDIAVIIDVTFLVLKQKVPICCQSFWKV